MSKKCWRAKWKKQYIYYLFPCSLLVLITICLNCLFHRSYGCWTLSIKLLDENPGVILDVRTKEEINNGHLENASFIDFYDEDFELKASWIKKNQPIYVYCHAGGRSSKAANILLKLGFKEVYNLIGGYGNWIDQKHPIVEQKNKKVSNLKSYSVETVENLISQENKVMWFLKHLVFTHQTVRSCFR